MSAEGAERPAAGPADFSLRRIGRAAGILAAAAFAGQVVTVVRELFVAAEVGAGAPLDAVIVATTAPVVIAGILSSGVRIALVPAHIETESRRGEAVARGLLGALLTWILLIAAAGTVLLILVPEPAVALAGPGLAPDARVDAIGYARVLAPLLFFGTLQHVMSAVCQIHDRFAPIASAMILGPAVSLVGTLALWPSLGLGALPASLLIGQAVAAIGLVLIAAGAGMLPRPGLSLERAAAGGFLRHAGPLTAGAAVLQLNVVSDRAVASLLGPGAISALRYGQFIVVEPLGALTLGWSTVVYPAIVRRAMTGADELGESLGRAARAALGLATPAAVWMAAVAPLVVELVYLRGAFDSTDLSITAAVVVGLSPMILFAVIQPVLTGAHNARRRAMLLAAVAFANAGLNVILDVLLGAWLGVGGIALATSATVLILLLFLATRISEPGFSLAETLRYGLRALIGSLVAVAPSLVIARSLPEGLGPALIPVLAVLAALTAVLYPAVAGRIGVGEPALVVRAAVGGVRRLGG
ncbi:MAG TPA: lipid II flippase MurJ [Candidatus Limnocylindrales bacterium]|nr:lipid II flippase MurJ [Candidatus Limnocylindrales bacterium]